MRDDKSATVVVRDRLMKKIGRRERADTKLSGLKYDNSDSSMMFPLPNYLIMDRILK